MYPWKPSHTEGWKVNNISGTTCIRGKDTELLYGWMVSRRCVHGNHTFCHFLNMQARIETRQLRESIAGPKIAKFMWQALVSNGGHIDPYVTSCGHTNSAKRTTQGLSGGRKGEFKGASLDFGGYTLLCSTPRFSCQPPCHLQHRAGEYRLPQCNPQKLQHPYFKSSSYLPVSTLCIYVLRMKPWLHFMWPH